MKKIMMGVGVVLLAVASCNPARHYTEQPINTLKGTLIKKPWSKSTQSYCAQGSDYWVLKEGTEEHVLELAEGSLTYKAASLQNKKVTVKGVWKERTIEAPDNPMMQRPVQSSPDGTTTDADFTCVVLLAMSIK